LDSNPGEALGCTFKGFTVTYKETGLMPVMDEQYKEAIVTITLRKGGRGRKPKVLEMKFKKPKINLDFSTDILPIPPEPEYMFRRVVAGAKSMSLRIKEQY
jgi:hypothetical protein